MTWRAAAAARLDAYSIPEPNTGCRLWLRSTGGSFGYGVVRVHGRRWYVHRLAWALAHDGVEPPSGVVLLHRCDTPTCLEVAHLTPGTHTTNMQDMWAKYRGFRASGGRNGRARLCEADAQAIRASPYNTDELAQLYGVRPATIRRIRRGERWGHLLPRDERQLQLPLEGI